MSVVSVEKAPVGRSASVDDQGNRSYSVPFIVCTDNIYYAWRSIEAEAIFLGLPARGVFYDEFDVGAVGDPRALCVRISANQTEHPYIWLVNCEFSTNHALLDQDNEDPTTRPILWESSGETVQLVRLYDINGNAVCNSAGEPFENIQAVEWGRQNWVFERYESNWTRAKFYARYKRVNVLPWAGDPARTWLIHDIRATETAEHSAAGNKVFRIRYELKFDELTWDHVYIDQGRRERINGELVEITDRAGKPVTKDVLLDGAGRRLALPANFQYAGINRNFRMFYETDFNLLNFPTPP